MLAIETRSLRKEFGQKVAVADLTLQVGQGEVFGFLGPNGAGKTTSVKMLLGLVHPTSGEGRLLGEPLGRWSPRAKVGFLPEHFRFHDWLTATEFLHLHSRLYGVPPAVARKRVPELLDLVVLTEAANRKLREFSKGMLQRIGLAQAMLNEPALIFLDEPTSGLDPIGRRLVRDIIRDLRARQTTIFLNSHLLSEVEITCDRVAFVKTGRVVRQATLAELAAGQTVVDLRVAGLTPETVNGLRNWTQDLTAQDGRLTLTLSDEEPLPAIASYLIGQGARLYEMTPRRTSLEDMFLEIMGPDSKPG